MRTGFFDSLFCVRSMSDFISKLWIFIIIFLCRIMALYELILSMVFLFPGSSLFFVSQTCVSQGKAVLLQLKCLRIMRACARN